MTRKADPRTARLPVPAGELPQFTPVPRQCNRHDGWTPARQRQFIEALADTGSVEAACRAVDMSQPGAYLLRRQPGAESFRAAWEKALDLGVQRIEDVAMDRALNGVEVPVYSYGKLVGTRRTYNDRLLMFMLRNRAPGRFADGRAKGLSAVDQMQLDRIKQQWIKEHEAQRAANTPSFAQVRASIERKVEALRLQVEAERQREWDALSEETRAAWEHFEALKARDLAVLKQRSGSADKDSQNLLESAGSKPQASQARTGARSACAEDSQVSGGERRRLRPNKETARPEPVEGHAPAGENNKIRTLKDDGWNL